MDKKWTWPEIHEMVQQITFTANQNTMRSELRPLFRCAFGARGLLRVFQIEVGALQMPRKALFFRPYDARHA